MSFFAGLPVSPPLNTVGPKTGDYGAAPNDFVPVDTAAGNVTVTLPTNPEAGTRVAVKMVNQGGSNAVTIKAGSGNFFNRAGGLTTGTLSLLNQTVTLQFSGSIWYATSDDLPLSQLDTRYLMTSSLTSLPTSDPHVNGSLWRSGNTLMVSTG